MPLVLLLPKEKEGIMHTELKTARVTQTGFAVQIIWLYTENNNRLLRHRFCFLLSLWDLFPHTRSYLALSRSSSAQWGVTLCLSLISRTIILMALIK